MPKYLDGTGLGYFWEKIKAYVNNAVKVTGIKGESEGTYRTGNVNITADNVNALRKNQRGNTTYLAQTSVRGVGDVTVRPLINQARANHLAFLPADQIIIEKTVDGGTTWTDAGVSDTDKKNIFAETRAKAILLPKINDRRSTQCGLRVTITAMKYNVPANTPETQKYNYWNSSYVLSTERYFALSRLYFWVNTSNDTMSIKVEKAKGSSSTTWVNAFDDDSYYMTGWSGSDFVVLTAGDGFGGSKAQTGNYWNWRLTFMTKGVNGTNTMGTGYETGSQSISEIRGYGDSVWTKPNEYMCFDKFYTHDADQNVTFPAKITAANGFVGNLTGSATKVNNHAVNTDVPADAVFTDTTYLPMTQAQATAGTSTDGMLISPKVLIDTIGSNVTVVVEDNKIKITSR